MDTVRGIEELADREVVVECIDEEGDVLAHVRIDVVLAL